MCRRIVLLVSIAALARAPSCPAAEFKGPEGFTLQYPAGWIVASKQQQDQVRGVAEELVGQANLSGSPRFAALIHDPKQDEFMENVNVVVTPGSPSIDDKAVEAYVAALRQQFTSAGMNLAHARAERMRVGDRDAISAHYDLTLPGIPEPLRQWQVVVPGAGRTYVITCSAPPSQFGQYEPQFTSIVNSFRIDRGLAGVWDSLPGPVRVGIVGGMIGGLVGGLVGAAKKVGRAARRRQSKAAESGLSPG